MTLSEPISPDENDADWIKRGTWDLEAQDVETLRAQLDAAGMTVEQFKELEVYRANVGRLAWLADL